MLYELALDWSLDLAASYMVGDRASDIEAGLRAGCTTVFIDRGYTAEPAPVGQAATVRSLGDAVGWIVPHARARRPAALTGWKAARRSIDLMDKGIRK